MTLALLDLTVIAGAWFSIRRHIAGRQQAEDGLQRSHDDLETRVAEARLRRAGQGQRRLAGRDERLRRQAEREDLRASEERFRGIFAQAAVGINVASLDGRWIASNPRLAEILGDTAENLFGATLDDFTPPDDAATDARLFHRLIAGEIDGYATWRSGSATRTAEVQGLGPPLHVAPAEGSRENPGAASR